VPRHERNRHDQDPLDGGIAEPGTVLTIRDDETADIEAFLPGVRGPGGSTDM
jgi:hypothetical protein